MSMPGFTAEASLGPSIGRYCGGTAFPRGSIAGDVVPAQFLAPMLSSIDLGSWLNRFPPMRCCRYVPILGRFVCVSQRVSPLEQCSCESDYFGFPIILCRPPVSAPF
jgi:hypothetical protein